MPRRKLIKTDLYPYHITNRLNNRQFFNIDMNLCWDVFAKYLTYANYLYGLQTHAFVLMSNHYHLIASTPDKNIGDAVKYFQREISKELNFKSGRINHLFGGRYHWSVITNEKFYSLALKYVYRNPCKAFVTYKVEEYPYSSLTRQLGVYNDLPMNLKIFKPEVIDSQLGCTLNENVLEWMNEPFNNEIDQGIYNGLRKTEFQIPHTKNKKAVVIDELLFSHRIPKR